jgi:hypothetical protein
VKQGRGEDNDRARDYRQEGPDQANRHQDDRNEPPNEVHVIGDQ